VGVVEELVGMVITLAVAVAVVLAVVMVVLELMELLLVEQVVVLV
jgi:hypothetical protein